MNVARQLRQRGAALRLLAPLIYVVACGCGESSAPEPVAAQPPAKVVFYTAPASSALMTAWADGLQPMVEVAAVPDPVGAVQTGAADAIRVATVADLECSECYRLDRTAGGWAIHGGAPLGIQYGATDLLEQLGFRFFHPWQTHMPARLEPFTAPRDLGRVFKPERALRGLHLHTLHPIEAFFDFWVPGDDAFEGARRTIPERSSSVNGLRVRTRIRERSGFSVGLTHVIDVLLGADTLSVRKW
jgi:hypothetical protein